MRRAILLYAVFALVVLVAVDRLWPNWPVHVMLGLAAIVVVSLAALAMVASGRR
jgi:hypothetical protein